MRLALYEPDIPQNTGTILRLATYDELDSLRLRALLESAFNRALGPAFFTKPASAIYLEEHYRGVAIVHDTELGALQAPFWQESPSVHALPSLQELPSARAASW